MKTCAAEFASHFVAESRQQRSFSHQKASVWMIPIAQGDMECHGSNFLESICLSGLYGDTVVYKHDVWAVSGIARTMGCSVMATDPLVTCLVRLRAFQPFEGGFQSQLSGATHNLLARSILRDFKTFPQVRPFSLRHTTAPENQSIFIRNHSPLSKINHEICWAVMRCRQPDPAWLSCYHRQSPGLERFGKRPIRPDALR